MQVALLLLAGAMAAHSTRAATQDSAQSRRHVELELNLPAYRLAVYADDTGALSFTVAIGARGFPTPTGAFQLESIVWNPVWVPPPSPWARGEPVTPPGPSNPMQKVKLQINGPYYLHGTPLSSSLGRAASHGCIRMLPSEAIALARLLQRATGAGITEAATDSLVQSSRMTRTVNLPAPVPLRIRYQLAEVFGDTLVVYPDVYNKARGRTDSAIVATLLSTGIDSARLNIAAIRSVAAQASRRPVRVPVGASLSVADTISPVRESTASSPRPSAGVHGEEAHGQTATGAMCTVPSAASTTRLP